jgi:hypothetical protein
MAKESESTKLKAIQAQKEYELERKRKRRTSIISYSIVALAAVFLWYLFTGERLAALCDALGIQPLFERDSGEYADCSLTENKNNKYCLHQSTAADREWDAMKKRNKFDTGPAAFSLTDNK